MNEVVTFHLLERVQLARHDASDSLPALAEWYNSVRHVPVENLTHWDLARAARRRLFLPAILPIMVERVTRDPFAGDKYEGELVVALATLSTEDWKQSPLAMRQQLHVAEDILEAARENEDIVAAMRRIRDTIDVLRL